MSARRLSFVLPFLFLLKKGFFCLPCVYFLCIFLHPLDEPSPPWPPQAELTCLFAVLELEMRNRTCSMALFTRGSLGLTEGCTTNSTCSRQHNTNRSCLWRYWLLISCINYLRLTRISSSHMMVLIIHRTSTLSDANSRCYFVLNKR